MSSHHIFIVRPWRGMFGVWENTPDWQDSEPLGTYSTATAARQAADRALDRYDSEN